MKSFKSHKMVEAAKIESVEALAHSQGVRLIFEGGIESVEVPYSFVSKSPTGKIADFIGGYLVRYADGYLSWSPADAFEEGYIEHSLDPKDGALPVAGYRPQTSAKVEMVNGFKADEERILRKLDALKAYPGETCTADHRWLAIGRTALEQAFMAINRSIFQPERAALPEDAPDISDDNPEITAQEFAAADGPEALSDAEREAFPRT